MYIYIYIYMFVPSPEDVVSVSATANRFDAAGRPGSDAYAGYKITW